MSGDQGGPQGSSYAKRPGTSQKASAILHLWCTGFWSALQLHKCLFYYVHDNDIWVKTAQCLFLNVVFFLGSMSLFDRALTPGSRWLLEAGVQPLAGPAAVASLLAAFQALFNAAWLIPVYSVSLVLNSLWYKSIAEKAFAVHRAHSGAAAPAVQPARSLSLALGQELYCTALFAMFFLQITLVGCIPVAGRPLKFVLLSWLYAFYCFDYKWASMNQPLAARIAYFESHWAFMSGFGAVCTLATVATPFYVGAALMAVLFPVFILLTFDTSPQHHMQRVTAVQGSPPLNLGHLPIFYVSTRLTGLLLRNINACMAFLNVFRKRQAR